MLSGSSVRWQRDMLSLARDVRVLISGGSTVMGLPERLRERRLLNASFRRAGGTVVRLVDARLTILMEWAKSNLKTGGCAGGVFVQSDVERGACSSHRMCVRPTAHILEQATSDRVAVQCNLARRGDALSLL